LLATTTDVIVTNVIEVRLFVLAFDRVTLCMDHSVLGNDTVLGGVGFNDLELDGSHTSSYEESVTLANRAVRIEEVRLQINFEQVTTQTLNGVVKGEDMYPLSVLDIETLVNIDKITEFYTQVVSRNLVQLDASFLDVIRGQADEDCVVAFLSPYDDGVTSE
jgi:hypothetical protein